MTRLHIPGSILLGVAFLAACGGSAEETVVAEERLQPLAVAAGPDIVVQLRDGTSVQALAARFRLTVVEQFGQRPIWRLRGPAGANVARLLKSLGDHPGVQYAELNTATQMPGGRNVSVWAIGGDAGAYVGQWAPVALRLPEAHAVTTGQGIRVAVLDTGIDLSHPVLVPRLARQPGGHVLGRDFVDGDDVPAEVGTRADAGFGHGTHVAGLVALSAPGARLMPARVLDAQGRGNAWVLAEALGWAVDPDGDPATDDGAHVVNFSLGGTRETQLLKTVTRLVTCDFSFDDDDDGDFKDAGFDADRERCRQGRGAVVIAAAGNAGNDIERLYPAAEEVKGSLAVTASTIDRQLAPFANYGGWIGVAAPGANIVSTVPGGGWGTWSGTSMAAPLASGTAALVMTQPAKDGDPSRPVPRQWRAEDVVKRLTDRVEVLCGPSIKQVDAAAAVRDEPALDLKCP